MINFCITLSYKKRNYCQNNLIAIDSFVFALCFYLFLSIAPCAAENTTPSFPDMPAIPEIRIRQGVPMPPSPPVPPKPAPIQQPAEQKGSKPKAAASQGLSAKTLSSLLQGSGNMHLLQNLLDRGKQQERGEASLEKILAALENLNENKSSKSSGVNQNKENTESKKEFAVQSLSETVAQIQKGPAADLIRFKLNGKDITKEFVFTLCSKKGNDESFLFSADRKFIAGNVELQETLYLLFKKKSEASYVAEAELIQSQNNPNSFLARFKKLSPLQFKKSGNMLFWSDKDSSVTGELLFNVR
ncbi:hypothetical protein DWQ65_04355 [Treponema phagedenis]|nr:hypothetical protein [Treponema phagedenis]QEJ95062.1 hypothetical protein FUT79_07525 [Treponema phagedenis]QEJ98264.1 hypothetical protein FUT82_09815 [Treponema phagedenis]QEK00987.1 hypothetical protein FUT84_07370 [Treponema phagedenis]QEK03775.1 hypothetical protein FUT83_08125 [Treponema phagedenis]QEK05996.1 hypothetical protein FUT80_04265 [Treponema phagedenis]